MQNIPVQGKEVKMNFDHGTTTLGFKYQVGNLVLMMFNPKNQSQFNNLVLA